MTAYTIMEAKLIMSGWGDESTKNEKDQVLSSSIGFATKGPISLD